MIIILLLNLLVLIVGGISSFLPVVTIDDIPYIGELLRTFLIQAMGVWNAFMTTFPYAEIATNVFIFVILPFEILLLIAKFFFGHRLPAHTN